jgi:formylglycine-generating enzyme required for sulfatase activity
MTRLRRPLALACGLACALLLAACGGLGAAPPRETSVPKVPIRRATPTATALPTATPAGVADAGHVTIPAGAGLAAFRISRTEVTNAQYARCVAAGACTEPKVHVRCDFSYSDVALAEHPVVCVTHGQARAYAAWAGGALPTDAQWTRACQGDDGRTYPWGEAAPDASRANYGWDTDLTNDATMPVGMFPADTSPYSLLDMAGNAAEDVESDDGDEQRSIVRGGAYYVIPENITCAARIEYGTDGSSRDVGFRVALSGD